MSESQPSSLLPEVITTARLVLRPSRPEDAPDIYEKYARDAEVTRYLLWRPHQSVVETQAFLVSQIARRGSTLDQAWVLTRPGEDIAFGMVGFEVFDQATELGYVLSRAEWGKGYMTEVVSAISGLALANQVIQRVWAICHPENVASARVLEKAGFNLEGRLEKYEVFPSLGPDPHDVYRYVRTN
ncbi:MAG: GNAT family N-acetyltransferase [Chloroflexi bacterium]|nr:GNAT family N-acetyltransferase [Chloroflexota bacterium]